MSSSPSHPRALIGSFDYNSPANMEDKEKDNEEVFVPLNVKEYFASKDMKIGKRLEAGSFGTVHEASVKGEPAAVKIIDLNKTPELFKTTFYKRELDALRSLSHPHIITVIDIVEEKDAMSFIFMELAEKGSVLDKLMADNKAIEEILAKKWSRQLALALEYIHSVDFAHHDLKLENCLVTKDDDLKLCDFGHSERVRDPNSKEDLESDNFMGSISYLAPEIFLKRPYAAIPSDVWSYGIVAYVMLHNSFPFDYGDHGKMFRDQCEKNFILATSVSVCACELLTSILVPRPSDRPTMGAILKHSWFLDKKKMMILCDKKVND